MAQDKLVPFKIEKKIPLPPRGMASRNRATAVLMEEGDSVFFLKPHSATAFSAVLKNLGFRSPTRKLKNGYRVWKGESFDARKEIEKKVYLNKKNWNAKKK